MSALGSKGLAMFKVNVLLVTVFSAPLGAGWDDESDDGFKRRNAGAGGAGDGDAAAGDPTQPGTCAVGVTHIGFGDEDFVAKRETGALGADRRRIKPYTALSRELERVLGRKPTNLTTSAAAFGDVPARWYAEPVAGAVTVYTTYSVAFTACYAAMGDAAHSTAPTAATAATECSTLQRKAWQRTPTAEETAACVDLAVTKLTTEPVPRRRWAHVCASVITSSGFITY